MTWYYWVLAWWIGLSLLVSACFLVLGLLALRRPGKAFDQRWRLLQFLPDWAGKKGLMKKENSKGSRAKRRHSLFL